jgi:hypothetical protein
MRRGTKPKKQMDCLCIWKELEFEDIDGVLSVLLSRRRMTCFRLSDHLPLYHHVIYLLMLCVLTVLRYATP